MDSDKLEKNLARVHEWTRAADQKVSILLTFSGIFLIIFVQNVFHEIFHSLRCNKIIFANGYIIALVLFGWAIIKCVWAIYPRLKPNHKISSPLYFKDIASISYESFKKRIKNMNEEDYKDELYKQIYSSAEVATKKFIAFRDALVITLSSISIFIFLEIYQKI